MSERATHSLRVVLEQPVLCAQVRPPLSRAEYEAGLTALFFADRPKSTQRDYEHSLFDGATEFRMLSNPCDEDRIAKLTNALAECGVILEREELSPSMPAHKNDA